MPFYPQQFLSFNRNYKIIITAQNFTNYGYKHMENNNNKYSNYRVGWNKSQN